MSLCDFSLVVYVSINTHLRIKQTVSHIYYETTRNVYNKWSDCTQNPCIGPSEIDHAGNARVLNIKTDVQRYMENSWVGLIFSIKQNQHLSLVKDESLGYKFQ